jgi:hypothetical protein
MSTNVAEVNEDALQIISVMSPVQRSLLTLADPSKLSDAPFAAQQICVQSLQQLGPDVIHAPKRIDEEREYSRYEEDDGNDGTREQLAGDGAVEIEDELEDGLSGLEIDDYDPCDEQHYQREDPDPLAALCRQATPVRNSRNVASDSHERWLRSADRQPDKLFGSESQDVELDNESYQGPRHTRDLSESNDIEYWRAKCRILQAKLAAASSPVDDLVLEEMFAKPRVSGEERSVSGDHQPNDDMLDPSMLPPRTGATTAARKYLESAQNEKTKLTLHNVRQGQQFIGNFLLASSKAAGRGASFAENVRQRLQKETKSKIMRQSFAALCETSEFENLASPQTTILLKVANILLQSLNERPAKPRDQEQESEDDSVEDSDEEVEFEDDIYRTDKWRKYQARKRTALSQS